MEEVKSNRDKVVIRELVILVNEAICTMVPIEVYPGTFEDFPAMTDDWIARAKLLLEALK